MVGCCRKKILRSNSAWGRKELGVETSDDAGWKPLARAYGALPFAVVQSLGHERNHSRLRALPVEHDRAGCTADRSRRRQRWHLRIPDRRHGYDGRAEFGRVELEYGHVPRLLAASRRTLRAMPQGNLHERGCLRPMREGPRERSENARSVSLRRQRLDVFLTHPLAMRPLSGRRLRSSRDRIVGQHRRSRASRLRHPNGRHHRIHLRRGHRNAMFTSQRHVRRARREGSLGSATTVRNTYNRRHPRRASLRGQLSFSLIAFRSARATSFPE